MLDLIIRGAQVHDGLGHPPVKADVAIHQGRVGTRLQQLSGRLGVVKPCGHH